MDLEEAFTGCVVQGVYLRGVHVRAQLAIEGATLLLACQCRKHLDGHGELPPCSAANLQRAGDDAAKAALTEEC